MSGPELIPQDFSGAVAIFPLPDLVMFPHVVQPLRVFEPRYVAMLEDSLASDGLLAMALLKPGWESEYEGTPPIHRMVCVGRVISHNQLADGSYNLLLAGGMRAEVRDEQLTPSNYRRATVELATDRYASDDPNGDPQLRQDLLDAFQQLASEGVGAEPLVRKLLEDQAPLGMLTDVIAYAAPLPLSDKQALLEDEWVEARARELILHLRRLARASSSPSITMPFPPKFSDN